MSPEHERLITLAFYAPIIVAMVLETLAPRRKATRSTGRRWLHIGGLWLINTALGQVALLASTLMAAAVAAERGWGLLPALALSTPVAFIAGFLLFDFATYLKHRAFHALPVLWQLHVVHHSDAEMDVGTGLRHHPADFLLDGFVTAGIVLLLGLSVDVVIVYLIAATIHNPIRHGNIAFPPWLDALLRPVLVTPDVHRIHHSSIERETNSNFGALFTCWDRLLGTYRAQPEDGHERMDIGLEYFRDPSEDRLLPMLTQPLRQSKARDQLRAAARSSSDLTIVGS